MHRVFKEHGIEYKKTYNKKCNPKKKYDPHYEVYEISQNDMKRLDGIFELPDGSWWRWCKGSNMGTPYEFFQVNGRELIAWGPEYLTVRLLSIRNAPLPMYISTSHGFGRQLIPDYYPRRIPRLVSCYEEILMVTTLTKIS